MEEKRKRFEGKKLKRKVVYVYESDDSEEDPNNLGEGRIKRAKSSEGLSLPMKPTIYNNPYGGGSQIVGRS
jgi:hypothetical protein